MTHVIDEVLDLIESTSEVNRSNLRDIYLAQFGRSIVPFCIARYHRTRRAPIRSDLVRFVIRYARDSHEVVDFGVLALDDRSKIVRESACALLAYSGDRRALPALKERVLKSRPGQDGPIVRAIDAIENSDHNRFHPEYTRWVISKDDPAQPKRESVDYYFGKLAPELMWRLGQIFEDPYGKWHPE